MASVIPCKPEGQSNWTQRTTLGGIELVLTFDWNQRDGHWLLTIADANGSPIVSAQKLVIQRPLLARAIDPRRPPGELVLIDSAGAEDPGFDDLGSARWTLYYVEAGDL